MGMQVEDGARQGGGKGGEGAVEAEVLVWCKQSVVGVKRRQFTAMAAQR